MEYRTNSLIENIKSEILHFANAHCSGDDINIYDVFKVIDDCCEVEDSTTKNDIDFKLKDYVSREAVRRIIKSPRTQEQMLNALNSLRNVTECKAEDCINRDYTAKYVEEFANNEYVSQDEAETIYLIADGIRHIPSALPDVHDNNVGNIDCISRADAIGSIAVECSAEKLDIDYAKFLMLRRAIKALPTVTPISKDCTDCIAEDKTFMKMDRIKQLLNSDKLDDSEVLEKIMEVVEE